MFVVFMWIWTLHGTGTTPAWAQGGSEAGVATIAGRVTDGGGGVIVGASVAVTGSASVSRTTVTDQRGEFVVTGLPTGAYAVTIDRQQFNRAVLHANLTAVEPRVELRVVLNLAAYSERVTVGGREVPYAEPEATTAGKVAVSRREIPNSVSVLTREQMQDQNMVNTWDALSQMTGVTAISNDGTQSQFHARGGALESQQDGVPSAMPFSGFQQYDLAIYERLEVLRGPAGLLQGSGSFSGVVNLVRRRPTAAFSASATASTGQWSNHHFEADVSGPLSGSVRALAVVAATDREFYYDRGHDRKWLGYGALEWNLTAATMLAFTAVHQNDRGPGFSGLPTYTNGRRLDVARSFNPYPVWNRTAWDTTDVGIDFEHRINTAWKVVTKINRRAQRLLFHDSFPGEGVNPSTNTTTYLRRESEFDYTNTSADAYVNGKFRLLASTHELLLGGNVSRYDRQGRGVDSSQDASLTLQNVAIASPPSVPEPTFTYRSGSVSLTEQSGLYSMLRSQVGGRVTTVLGGRWSNYDTRSRNIAPSTATDWVPGAEADMKVTPYGGVVVDVTRTSSLYASYSEIFVPQTQRQIDGSVLDPRVGYQWEAGAKGEHLNNRLLTALAVFTIRDRNRSYPDVLNPGFFVPLGEVESRGWEAEVTGQVTRQWDVSTGYTRLDTKHLVNPTLTGEPINHWYPRHSLKAWSMWRFPTGRLEGFKVGLGVQAYSKSASGRDTVNAAGVVTVAARRQSAYAVASANLSYLLPRNVLLTVQVNNMFDQTYYTRLGGTNTYNVFGEPRNALVSLRWQL